jgi:hypothetical protein
MIARREIIEFGRHVRSVDRILVLQDDAIRS